MIKDFDNLPDIKAFVYRGYPCLIYRQDHGAYCAYVGLNYAMFDPDTTDYMDAKYKVHGGVTFASWSPYYDDVYASEMNVPLAKYFWLGFDAAHSSDIVPAYSTLGKGLTKMTELGHDFPLSPLATFKDIPFMEKELCGLVDQIIKEKDV